ncbi:MAG: GIY-YIG nuclease family protein [Luteibaculaceae bacterium]
MSPVCFILKKYDRLYVGQTSSLIERFNSHNSLSKKGFTVRYRPWQDILVDFFETHEESLQRERELKQGKGRAWIRKYVLPNYL